MKTSSKLAIATVLCAIIAGGLLLLRHAHAAALAAEAVAAEQRAHAAALARAQTESAKQRRAANPNAAGQEGNALAASAKTAQHPQAALQMPLAEMLGPNNFFHDDLYGVSVTFPEGWTVRNAIRWGRKGGENTVFLGSNTGTSRTSMYYQKYPDGAAPPLDQTESYFRSQAAWKEQSRNSAGSNDYANVPDSFSFEPIDGHPAESYFATFTANGTVNTEYFIRVLGQQGYVMFFTQGTLEDVNAARPQIQAMAKSVHLP